SRRFAALSHLALSQYSDSIYSCQLFSKEISKFFLNGQNFASAQGLGNNRLVTVLIKEGKGHEFSIGNSKIASVLG
ncbi:MAG: hypothetical protein PUP91_31085, partial [Rhizonema sp. PD37]|nr:hypothetical protein [Rhizonema sp. PD37]